MREWIHRAASSGSSTLERHPCAVKTTRSEISLADPKIQHSCVSPHDAGSIFRVKLEEQKPIIGTLLEFEDAWVIGRCATVDAAGNKLRLALHVSLDVCRVAQKTVEPRTFRVAFALQGICQLKVVFRKLLRAGQDVVRARSAVWKGQ